jgi:hypothetical protein
MQVLRWLAPVQPLLDQLTHALGAVRRPLAVDLKKTAGMQLEARASRPEVATVRSVHAPRAGRGRSLTGFAEQRS